tara:strand:- start:390 stop:935 length:546 start_codon:yes stop_codon:yes gene_type:complete
MTLPLIMSAALSGAQLGLGLSATENEAKMAELKRQNLTDSAKENFKINTKILLRKAEEQERAYVQSRMDTQVEAMEAESASMVAAGESGVGGNSVQGVLNDIKRQKGKIDVRNKVTYANVVEGIKNTHTQQIHQMISAINGIPAVPTPDYLTPFVSAASTFATESNFKALGWNNSTSGTET